MFEKFLSGEKFNLDADGNVAYCSHYDLHERTGFGTCSGPAISPPEIDYPALTAKGLILVPPAQMAYYLDMSGDEQIESIIQDLEPAIDNEVIPFEYDDRDRDNKLEIRYMGEIFGFGFFYFDLDVCGDEVYERRAAMYERISY